jgi:riboflavin synthase
MFTGLIEQTGEVASFARTPAGWRLEVSSPGVGADAVPGESIAVNGCCLTVLDRGGPGLRFDVLEETRRLTNLGGLAKGAAVNLERSLRADSRLGGHFVTGHIDGTGTIEAMEKRGADTFLRVSGPSGSGRMLVHKGSVAIDGISLTVAEVEGDSFSVWIIPHTRAVTNLRARAIGDAVNLEFDMLGKYVEKLLQGRLAPAR